MGSFIVTIDTEGDDLWGDSEEITTRNALFLPRFQAVCERYRIRPTYLVNYEMAVSPAFVEFGLDVVRRKVGEIGMHLHAWNSPPVFPLTACDHRYKPYLIEYPAPVIWTKVDYMTKLLQDTFDVPITSHRAGRWAMNGVYAKSLISSGYTADCSVTPHVDWSGNLGDPERSGGSNYRHFPSWPYFIDPDDISTAGDSPLLEVPMTVTPHYPMAARSGYPYLSAAGRVVSGWLGNCWLRPDGRNLASMRQQLHRAAGNRSSHAEFMLHSSELMPNGSPTFRTADSIEKLYDDLESLFSLSSGLFQGQTLREFRAEYDLRRSEIRKEPDKTGMHTTFFLV